MNIDIQLTREAIPQDGVGGAPEAAGAWVEFRGLVRGEENGVSIAALEYEAYSPMAERKMREILLEIAQVEKCLTVRVIHRIGVVPVGEAAIYVGIAGRHRGEAFAMLSKFMDRLKQVVPIWKCRGLPKVEVFERTPTAVVDLVAHSAAEVLEIVTKLCPPLGSERIRLSDAVGRVLREPVVAPEDQPEFDRSSVDGYAVRCDDPGMQFRVVNEIRAGEWKPRELEAGQAVRVATGAAVPGGGLQILMKEDVKLEGATIAAVRRNGESNIRHRGDDARAGQVLVRPGEVLQPGAAALLASVGCADPAVTRLPRVLHIATGNEIVSPEQQPRRGQIRDSNSTLVRAFLSAWRIEPEQLRVGEDENAIGAAIDGRLANRDLELLLISGGASVGEHDFTRALLERAGFDVHVNKTTARPGKPLIVAQRGTTLAFGLPGNPLAHFVCLNLYVRAALETWAGVSCIQSFHHGTLVADLACGGNARETFWPARWQMNGGRVELHPLRWASSGDLTSLATANALLRVTSGARVLCAGTKIEFVSTERNT